MNKKWVIALTVIAIMLIALFYYYHNLSVLQTLSYPLNDDQCIDSFDTFAFTTPNRDKPEQEFVFPLPQWHIESKLPNIQSTTEYEVVAIRFIGNNQEIWISSNVQDVVDYSTKRNDSFLRCHLDTQTWDEIQAQIENTEISVENIYKSNDNSVWGLSLIGDPNVFQSRKVIYSVYNENLHLFEEMAILELPDEGSRHDELNNSVTQADEIILDPQDKFWLLTGEDIIYSFDPINQKLKSYGSLENMGDIHDLLYAPDGSLYFSTSKSGKGAVFQFIPTTGEIISIDLPYGSLFSARLIDHTGSIWLNDAYASLGSDKTWQELQPNPMRYWWDQEISDYWRYYSPPDPFFESSDGRIWFRIDRSNNWKNLRSGIAWYDPNKREGCWFTSEGAKILEDTQQNLWMVLNNYLYTYKLIPEQ